MKRDSVTVGCNEGSLQSRLEPRDMPPSTPEEGTKEPGSSLRDTDAGLKGEKMGEGVAICRPPHNQVQEVPGVCLPAMGVLVEAGTPLTRAAFLKHLYEEAEVRAPDGSPC